MSGIKEKPSKGTSTLRKIFRKRTSTTGNPNEALGGIRDLKIKEKDKDKKDLKSTKPRTEEPKEKDQVEKTIISANGVNYETDDVVGSGSFGVVKKAVIQGTNEVVAIKKVFQDKRYKNRELQIMQMVNHPNIVALKSSFFTNGDSADEVYLNLVLEFVPDTVYKVSRTYAKAKQSVPLIHTKLYIYQLLRALNYIHLQSICHRDIKPQNLLVDPELGILKLCDFGSAKILVQGESNVAYICSRYYRAPELIFGATNYTTAIDVWSTGCVLAELLLGQPLFPGESGVDQLVEIIRVLGTPTKEEIFAMNQSYSMVRPFPQIKKQPWTRIFKNNRVPNDAIDLVTKLLQYIPTKRLKALEACAHPFFDEIREPGATLPNGNPLPRLFDFTEQELKGISPSLVEKLIPEHYRKD